METSELISSPPKHSKKSSVILNIVVCGLLLTVSYFLIINKQKIIDQFAVWQYKSSSQIDSIVKRTGLNDYGKFLFYASQPTLDGTQSFNAECTRIEKSTAIFGCYKDSKIYIYNVTDEKLDGIREVTAAHETLHAAYARMDNNEKSEVNKLVENEYKKLENNTDFSTIVKYYESTEPGQRDNELFAIIGTEVSNIDSKLESYYNKYFSNRQAVVALNTKYLSVFNTLEAKSSALSTQLDTQYKEITAEKAQYELDVSKFNSDVEVFNNTTFLSVGNYNTELANLRSREAKLNTTRTSINNEITNYSNLLSEYNSIISQSKELYNSIDSTLAPASSIK